MPSPEIKYRACGCSSAGRERLVPTHPTKREECQSEAWRRAVLRQFHGANSKSRDAEYARQPKPAPRLCLHDELQRYMVAENRRNQKAQNADAGCAEKNEAGSGGRIIGGDNQRDDL